MNLDDFNLCGIVESYMVLRRLEDSSDYYGNTDFLLCYFPHQIRELCDFVYSNYELKDED